jgi:hypothetical protein
MRYVDPAGNREPGAATELGQPKLQRLAGVNKAGVAGRQRRRPKAHIELAAAPRDDPLILESQLQTAECDFEPGRACIIADEEISHAQGKCVESPA